jgi:hypothetical protein
MPVPNFSPGEVLTAGAMDSIGLWKVASASFSGITTGAPLDVNSVFSSDYTNYLLLLRCAQTVANGSTVIRMRTVAAQENGSVYNYGWGGAYVSSGPAFNFGGYALSNPFTPDNAFFSGISAGTGYTGSARLEIMSPNVARATRFIGQAFTDYTGLYYNVSLSGAGEVATLTQYTGFRLFPVSGTISGEYTLYGYNK